MTGLTITLSTLIALMTLLIVALIVHNKHQAKLIRRYSRGCFLTDLELSPMDENLDAAICAIGQADLDLARKSIGAASNQLIENQRGQSPRLDFFR